MKLSDQKPLIDLPDGQKVELVNLELLDNNNEFMQTSFWAGFKAHFGWRPYAARITAGGTASHLLVLARNVLPFVTIGYIPYPGFSLRAQAGSVEIAESISNAIAKALPIRLTFIRYDLLDTRGQSNPDFTGKLKKAAMDIQPPNTVLLDLTLSHDELLAGMHSKTRYNIKLAEKKGVEVFDATDDYEQSLKVWYEIYKETGIRDKITIHSFEYYKTLFALSVSLANPRIKIKLLLARVEGEVIAGIVLALCNKQAVYLYGASGNHKRNYMPNYALQWQAILLAAKTGCTSYDFFGIPEADDPAHPMHGLYRFKTGFGGQIVQRAGCYDYPISTFLYALYRVAEKIRKFYYKKIRRSLS